MARTNGLESLPFLVRKSAKQCKARWYEWRDPSIKKVHHMLQALTGDHFNPVYLLDQISSISM
ncbi:hypothetical protein S245_006496 [Arachis hypogaea]